MSGTFLPTSDPGLYERWERVLQYEPCEQTALGYRALRLAHFGPAFDTDALECALETICSGCAASFIADKRAVVCQKCADAAIDAAIGGWNEG